MIDENKLIEELFYKMPYKFGAEAMEWFRHLVEAQPKIGEWIPCSDRLPEDNGYYLVKRCNSLIHKMPTEIYPSVLYFEKPKIWSESPRSFETIENCYVIEWKPIERTV